MERNRLETADDRVADSVGINTLLKTVEDEIKAIRQAIDTLSPITRGLTTKLR